MRRALNVVAFITTLTAALPAALAQAGSAAGTTSPSSGASSTVLASSAAAAARPPVRLKAIVPPGPPPAIMPLSEVRPGMVGEALTVFQGTKPEPFKVRVVAVLRNFLPKQDVILIRAEDPRVEFSGIVAGMSGSPVYIEGKLMGAVAYAWSFSKEALGGVTPIESMLAERQRPRRVKEDLIALAKNETAPRENSEVLASLDAPAALTRGLGLPPVAPTSGNGPRLQRTSVPLSMSGFGSRSVAELEDALKPFGLMPMQAGGGRRPGPEQAGRVEPGSAVGVELVRGDMSTVGTGTVTYVDGETVLAFGHPMFGIGEVYLPMVDAEIHGFMSSLAQSFKMSSPLNEVGVLVQDRQSCIIGDLGLRTTMVPVTVKVGTPGEPPHVFHAEVARNKRLTPMLASVVASNAIADAEPDVTDMVVTVTSKVNVKGYGPLELRDQIFSSEGVSSRALASSRGLRAMGDMLFNPFEPVAIDRLDLDVRVEFRRDVAEIVGVSLPGDVVHAGDTVPLRVTLRPYAGPEYVEVLPFQIPQSVAGQVIKLEVATGASVRPEMAQAESLHDYIENYRRFFTASSIVVSVQTADDGAALRGRLLNGLPASALDTLRPGNQTRRADAFRVAQRSAFPSKRLVTGKQELSILVRDDSLGRNR